ncbi:alpha-acetolactate decarboxylase domain-containing protein [Trichoderma breve]|uniref:Alpha-acetolactate decarboxylase n=1 Tax=Trichoderma breve TaxID=2034170 RepID=A0A9W9BF95_9HYPO|nr:alpha-acetolactate decarboxylase domain-containing protein [Trichoderma breve]KAJ4861392.1 alpha-acetolactate decarboxylase domain-containing protein [Trichoderma breve]
MAPNELFQYSIVTALMDGVAESGLTLSDLLPRGDFGLGTFRHMVGEMIVLDGVIYQMKADGSVTSFSRDQLNTTVTPFAMVTHFRPTLSTKVTVKSKGDFGKLLTDLMPQAKNIFSSIRLEGKFKAVVVRTVGGQQHPGEKLSKLAESQVAHSFEDVQGSIVGFRSPSYMQGISVAGDHLHFISADRRQGGHLLELETDGEAELAIAAIRIIHTELPTGDDFVQATLQTDSEGITKAES